MRETRLALLTEIAAPYRIPLFNSLAERVGFRVLFLSRADPRRPYYEPHDEEWRFDHRFLSGREVRRDGRWIVLSRGVLRELHRLRPDAVAVGGWNQPAFWLALAYSRARRIPFLVWVESTERDARPDSRPLEAAKRLMIRGASGFFVPGRASAEYVRSFGVPDDRIALAPNAADARVFERAVVNRTGRGMCTFLYAGRFDSEKGLDDLLRAFADVPGELLLAGSGPEEGQLRALADDRVRFLGPLDRDDLAAVYARADVFVLPSRSEPWGMVLNEAAAAGLPLIATEGVGAARDLIEKGRNGLLVPVGDPPSLATAMRRFAEDEAFRVEAGAHSREIAARFTPDAWADGVATLARRLAR